MSQTMEATKKEKVPMNGVDTPTLLATINAVGNQPDLAKFQFRASSRWVDGTHSHSTVEGFYGLGAQQSHRRAYRGEFMERIERTPPVYLVVGLGHATSDKAQILADFPELAGFLRGRYELETTIGLLDLYRLRE